MIRQSSSSRRRTLIAVSGNSPQIITETLYALGTDPEKHGHFWPDTLEIITTSFGEKAITAGLMDDRQLDAVCQQVGKPPLPRTAVNIRCIPGKNQQPVEDARNEADHEAMANFITQRVRELTQDKNTQLHASIAGGRKTMTFFLGYAMSLFGRHFDHMSHVLVTDGYEGRRDFYFPTTDTTLLACRPGEKTPLDAKDADVTLTDIPFIRLRNLLPENTLYERRNVDEAIDFRHVVDLINLGDTPEEITLNPDPTALALHIGHRRQPHINAMVKFTNPLHWAFYNLLLEDTQSDPESRQLWERDNQKSGRHELLRDLLYDHICTLFPDTLASDGTLNSEALTDIFPNAGRTYISLKNGVRGKNFSSLCNEIKQLLQQDLPKNLCEHLTPIQMFDTESGNLDQNVFKSEDAKPKKAKPGASYGIPLRSLVVDEILTSSPPAS